jgi:16S rRNA processing protein RimM
MNKDNQYIECAKIVNTHGCHGGIKMESWCNSPDDLAKLKRVFILKNGMYEEYKLRRASVFKQFVVADLDGVSDMDQALALKNQVCFAKRSDFHLEKGEYFIADLIGLPVIDADNGKEYGHVKELINRGASDLYVVKTKTDEAMIPDVPQFIDHVDVKKGVFIRPIEGMFPAEDV